MSANGFPSPGQGAVGGINSEIEASRAHTMVLQNSRVGIALYFLIGAASLFMAGCMALMVINLLFLSGSLNFRSCLAAAQWGLGAVCFVLIARSLWRMGRHMAWYRITLDSRGVDFKLGTRSKPEEVFMPWDTVILVEQKQVGSAWQFFVKGRDGSSAQFSNYSFFRPKRILRLIGKRAGIAVQSA
jgi:hypothetical protein